MGNRSFARQIYEDIPDHTSRLLFWFGCIVGLPALMVTLAFKMWWFWKGFGLFGIAFVVLLTWAIVLICLAAYAHWRAYSGTYPIGTTELPLLTPAQEQLLSLLVRYQRQFATKKLIIDRKLGRLYFDEDRERGKDVSFIADLFGAKASDGERQLEELMYSLPTEYLRALPTEGRLGGPYVVAITDAGLRYIKDKNLHFTPHIAQSPIIEIRFEKRAPYETTEPSHNNVVSTVRIGIGNSGGGALSNCRVFIEASAPAFAIPGGLPLLLDGAGFIVRHDDPEKLVVVATHWANGPAKMRLNAPISGNFSDSLMNVDDSTPRTISIKVVATECQQTASFKLWTDEAKAVHLEFISYIT